jgi:cytoskeletal protein CcmA (bactofilin family)
MIISGTGSVKGNLEAAEVNVSGQGIMDAVVQCDRVTVSGMMRASSVIVDEVHVSGLLETEEDISAEDAVIHGCVKAGGLINAERLEVTFDGESCADSIGGSSIRIRRKGTVASAIQRLLGRKDGGCFLVNGGVEGDEIDLEYVIAESVTGKNIKIGPGCRIGRVVFSGTYQCSEEAEVESVNGE